MENRDMNVAKAMIAAGIEAAGNIDYDMGHDMDWDEEDGDAIDPQPSYTLH